MTARPRVGERWVECGAVPFGEGHQGHELHDGDPTVVSKAGDILEAKIGVTDYRLVYRGVVRHIYLSPIEGPCANRITLDRFDGSLPVFKMHECDGEPGGFLLCDPASLGREYCSIETTSDQPD